MTLTVLSTISAVEARPENCSVRLDSSLAVQVVDLISMERYGSALRLADSLITNGNPGLQGWFLRASILSGRSTDFEDELDDDALTEACDSVTAICSRLIDEGDHSAVVRFYLGAVDGYLSFREFKRDNRLKAISYGRRMARWLGEAVSLDSSCYDAYLGLGSFYYHSSDKAGLLRSLGLVSDRREEGLSLIRICAEHGTFSRQAARSNLAWIAISRKEYDTAIRIAGQLLEEYPEGRSFLWCLGRAQMEAGRWSDAVDTYRRILSSVRSESRNNRYNEIGCLHALARAHAGLGDWAAVVRLADEALGIQLTRVVAERKANDIKRLKKLREEGLKRTAGR